jgi:mRNA-degrading endonuclease RelE of RelBE toxin-antitoxin system
MRVANRKRSISRPQRRQIPASTSNEPNMVKTRKPKTSLTEVDDPVAYRHDISIIHCLILLYDAAMQLGELPKPIKARMVELLVRLAKWPAVSGAKPLSGKLAGHYRLRTGDYRMQFRVEADRVCVEQVGHRDGFYDEADA